jgi:hypothetical protein
MKNNQALTRYINVKRKEESRKKDNEARKKAEEKACKKAMEGQSFKDVRTWRK